MSFAPLLYDADANTYTFTGVDNIIVLLYDPCSDKIAHEAHMKRNQNDIECFLYTEKKNDGPKWQEDIRYAKRS